MWQTVEKFGKIDILVNNAGINPHFGDLLDVGGSKSVILGSKLLLVENMYTICDVFVLGVWADMG